MHELDAGLTRAVRAAGFRLLLARGTPVTVEELVDAVGAGARSVRSAMDESVRHGSARVDAEGRLVGTCGLSVVPHRHEILVGERRFWTWCAYDAVGILGALRADGLIRTSDPESGQRIEIAFTRGRTAEGSAVLFVPDFPSSSSVIDEWCPNANLFESEANARAWAGRRGIAGEVLSLSQAVKVGAGDWGPLLTRGRA